VIADKKLHSKKNYFPSRAVSVSLEKIKLGLIIKMIPTKHAKVSSKWYLLRVFLINTLRYFVKVNLQEADYDWSSIKKGVYHTGRYIG
jgi:hypothetical protein